MNGNETIRVLFLAKVAIHTARIRIGKHSIEQRFAPYAQICFYFRCAIVIRPYRPLRIKFEILTQFDQHFIIEWNLERERTLIEAEVFYTHAHL